MTPNIWTETEKFSRCSQISKYYVSKTVKCLSEPLRLYLGNLCIICVAPSVLSSRKHYKFQTQCITSKDVLSSYFVGNTELSAFNSELCLHMICSPLKDLTQVHRHTENTVWSEYKHKRGREKALWNF